MTKAGTRRAVLALAACFLAGSGAFSPAAADAKLRVGKAQAQPFTFAPLDIGVGEGSTDGKFNPKALAALSRSFVELGTLQKQPDMTKLYTEKFLPGSAAMN